TPRGREARLGQRDGLGENRPRHGDLLGAGGPVVALVQRHDRDAGLRAARGKRARALRSAPRGARAVAGPEQEEEPVEVHADDRGDFFAVSRKYFKREATAAGFVLKPLADGTPLAPGDEVEVQISLSSKHEAEYVHLRDPRAAGLEPENAVSRHRWELGLAW